MPKDINILIVEDDLYARDLMTLLLTRDWRTRVVAEVGTEDSMRDVFDNDSVKIDVVIIDTEVPDDPEFPFRLAELANQQPNPPKIIATATKPDTERIREIISSNFSAYLLKKEIRYSLATAAALVYKQNKWVVTPEIYRTALQARVTLPENLIIVDGSKPLTHLTHRESEVARLAILFNLAHRDLADELVIRADQVSKYVSNAYTKLGLDEILNGEVQPELYFQDRVVLNHFQNILSRVDSGTRRKTSDMATLAFHMLTMPETNERY